MLVLGDTACLAHQTVELLGSRMISAKESPERLLDILEKIKASGIHTLRMKHTPPESSFSFPGLDAKSSPVGKRDNHDEQCMRLLLETHDEGYVKHLMTAHQRWVKDELIDEAESILPECFRVPNIARDGTRERVPPPKDIYAQTGYYAFDMSTGICKDTWHASWASCLLAYEAVCAVRGVLDTDLRATLTAEDEAPKNVLALCRPPGHHCNTHMAGGYCYVNNAVIAVEAFLRHHVREGEVATVPNVAILDLDFHHGNGTQDAFYNDPILYVSIHGEDEYPYYTGFANEVGAGPGKGYNCNLPLKTHSTADQYLAKVDEAVRRLQEFKPDYLIVSLGFDTFNTDPLGCFKLETADYEMIAARVRCSDGLQDVPCVILLEGGYVVEKLGYNMLSFLKGWESQRG